LIGAHNFAHNQKICAPGNICVYLAVAYRISDRRALAASGGAELPIFATVTI
jgi:hypothetical protein